MERFVKGDIVVIPFPFVDIPRYKKRPSLIIAETGGSHVILCQITSQKKQDKYAIPIDNVDLESGTLNPSLTVVL
jgi:mRNA interferase MazF